MKIQFLLFLLSITVLITSSAKIPKAAVILALTSQGLKHIIPSSNKSNDRNGSFLLDLYDLIRNDEERCISGNFRILALDHFFPITFSIDQRKLSFERKNFIEYNVFKSIAAVNPELEKKICINGAPGVKFKQDKTHLVSLFLHALDNNRNLALRECDDEP